MTRILFYDPAVNILRQAGGVCQVSQLATGKVQWWAKAGARRYLVWKKGVILNASVLRFALWVKGVKKPVAAGLPEKENLQIRTVTAAG